MARITGLLAVFVLVPTAVAAGCTSVDAPSDVLPADAPIATHARQPDPTGDDAPPERIDSEAPKAVEIQPVVGSSDPDAGSEPRWMPPDGAPGLAPDYPGAWSELDGSPDSPVRGSDDAAGVAGRALPVPGGLVIDTWDRAAVAAAYRSYHLGTEAVVADWTGDVAACRAGLVARPYMDAMLVRVNFFRAMAGLIGNVRFDPLYSHKAQQAALIMHAAGALSHVPDPTWPCHTWDGSQAAGSSNLELSAGPRAITAYMRDDDPGEVSVGRRRWLLYPPTAFMGAGDTGSANALWVIGGFTARPSSPRSIAWPPQGYVPRSLVFERWSFAHPGADFRAATVAVSVDGQPANVDVIHRGQDGMGDAVLVWTIQSGSADDKRSSPSADTVYEISIEGVGTPDGPLRAAYRVVAFDPDAAPATPTATPSPSPTATSGTTVTPSVTPVAPVTDTPTLPTSTTEPPTEEPSPTVPPPTLPVPMRCPDLRAPEAVIVAALDHPETVSGWLELCNPSIPFDPIYNAYRTSLELQNPGVPYNPMSNGLVFRCGCR